MYCSLPAALDLTKICGILDIFLSNQEHCLESQRADMAASFSYVTVTFYIVVIEKTFVGVVVAEPYL